MSKRKIINLKSCDDQVFEVDEDVATCSPILSLFFTDENHSDNPISFPRISGKILGLIINYCYCSNRFALVIASDSVHPLTKQRVSGWEYDFINTISMDKDTLFSLTKAANYLHIEGLLNLACKTLTNFIPRKTPDQIRTIFTIKNRHYKEEDEKIRKELGWLE